MRTARTAALLARAGGRGRGRTDAQRDRDDDAALLSAFEVHALAAQA